MIAAALAFLAVASLRALVDGVALKIVSVDPSADAVTGRVPVATDDGASMHGNARPASASGHQERKEGGT